MNQTDSRVLDQQSWSDKCSFVQVNEDRYPQLGKGVPNCHHCEEHFWGNVRLFRFVAWSADVLHLLHQRAAG